MVDAVETEVFNMEQKEIPSRAIGEIVMDKMKNLDPVAYVRFASVYREFKDVNTFMDELKSVLKKEADGIITDSTDKSTPLLKKE